LGGGGGKGGKRGVQEEESKPGWYSMFVKHSMYLIPHYSLF